MHLEEVRRTQRNIFSSWQMISSCEGESSGIMCIVFRLRPLSCRLLYLKWSGMVKNCVHLISRTNGASSRL